jgi:hypothetical protein
MTHAILDGTNLDTSVFAYSAPKAHASGGKVVNLLNKTNKESLTLSTPLMLTWGAQESKDQAGNPLGKYTMSLQFPNADYPNADGEACLESMKSLEAKVKADAMTYSKDWFGKTITNSEVMDEKFNVMLRYPKVKGTTDADYNRAPTLSVKIPCWSGVWKTEVYDEDGEPQFVNGKVNTHLNPLEFIKSKTRVICLIQCGGLWFVNGKVSITWNLKQVIVQKPRDSLEGTCFLKPKPAEMEALKSDQAAGDDDRAVVEDEYDAAKVEDSDAEEEVEQEEEEEEEEEIIITKPPTPPPEPEPIKKKRVVKKKAA